MYTGSGVYIKSHVTLLSRKGELKRLILQLRGLSSNLRTADFNNSFIPLFVGISFDTARSLTCKVWMRKLRRIALLRRISPGIYHSVQRSVCTFWARGKSTGRVFQVCLWISNLRYHRFLRNRLCQQLVTCGFLSSSTC